jgi:uncharacterized protein YraI
MSNFKLALAAAIGLATLAGVGAAIPATAAEARASGNVPVRECPRSYCRIIDHLEDGEYYEVLDCRRQQTWCLVADRDGDELGWVRGSYLVGSAAKNRVTPFEFLVNPEFRFNN